MGMMGSLVKNYLPAKIGKDAKKIYSVAVMPCTAKKYEASRDEMKTKNGDRYIDAVLTTRELVWMLKTAGVDLPALEEGTFDSPLGKSTGAGVIFGTQGGVMEAAVRSAYFLITKKEMPGIELTPVRGSYDEIKEATVDIDGLKVNVAVASSLGSAQKVLDMVKSGEKQYHFIEVMTCPGGCVAGGGQPYPPASVYPMDKEFIKQRASALYKEDRANELRRSHENPEVKELYADALESPRLTQSS